MDAGWLGRRRISGRVKFLPLAWAGCPKQAFTKIATPRSHPHRFFLGFIEMDNMIFRTQTLTSAKITRFLMQLV